MMDSILKSLGSEGWSWAMTFVGIAILKLTDYLARAVGNALRRGVPKLWLRYLIYFILAGGLLYGSGIAFKRNIKPNLYQKYGATRLYRSSDFRELYRKLARGSHPDMKGGKTDFTSMTSDLKLLINDKSRLFYDRFQLPPAEGSVEEEFGMQIAKGIECFMDYFGKSAFVVIFITDEPNLQTKMSTLGLVIAALLYDIYNLSARSATTTDPLDFVYPDLTLSERSLLIRNYFPLFFFLLIVFKFAFEVPWVIRYRDVTTLSTTVLNYLEEMDIPEHRQIWSAQNKAMREDYYSVAKCMRIAIDKRENTLKRNTEATAEGTQPPSDQINSPRAVNPPINPTDNLQNQAEPHPQNQPPPQEPPARPRDLFSLLGGIAKTFLIFYLVNTGIKYLSSL
jgi:hypothetical protein